MIFKVAWKNIITNPLSSFLSATLFAISIIIILLLSIVGYQLEEKFKASKERVNMVVGAPGSEMDLIMSSIYHISPPVQNIKIKDAAFIIADPSVSVVPLAMGDHWAEDGGKSHGEDVERRRIVGTDTSYLSLYDAKIKTGRVWEKDMEVVIGSEVNSLGLKIGDKFAGVHGMVGGGADAHVHEDQLYTVVGILEPSGTVLDQLILCTVQSVWHVHEGHGHGGPEDNKSMMAGVRQEFQPPSPDFIYTPLDMEAQDSIQAIIEQKLSNIRKFTAIDSFNLENPMSKSSKIKQDMLRIRSNLKSIVKQANILAGSQYGDMLQLQADSSFSVRDSFSMAGHSIARQLNSDISELENLVNSGNNMPALIQKARSLESMTYDFVFAYERVRTDSLIQVRREMMRKRGIKINQHYLLKHLDKELTSLLVTFRGGAGGLRLAGTIKEDYQNRLGVAMVDVQVDNLYSLVEPGVNYIKLVAYIIMVVSGISVLISLIKSLRERKYEMALMRVMGATRLKIFALVLLEGIMLAILGFGLGFVTAHLLAEMLAGQLQAEYHYDFTGFIFLKSELWVFLITLGIGFVSALVPALMIMRTNISKTLSKQ